MAGVHQTAASNKMKYNITCKGTMKLLMHKGDVIYHSKAPDISFVVTVGTSF
jgi:hypothetical protein